MILPSKASKVFEILNWKVRMKLVKRRILIAEIHTAPEESNLTYCRSFTIYTKHKHLKYSINPQCYMYVYLDCQVVNVEFPNTIDPLK